MEFPVTKGAPQGSVIGPLLFLIFANDLIKLLNNDAATYADDTNILVFEHKENELLTVETTTMLGTTMDGKLSCG